MNSLLRVPAWLARPRMLAAAALAAATIASAATSAQAWVFKVCADPNNIPQSRIDGTGYENRIAEIVADALGAELEFIFFGMGEQMMNEVFRVGECDAVMGVPDGAGGMLTTLSYYRSPFVFAYRSDRGLGNLNNFDDPILRGLRIGVQPSLGPTHQALLTRGLGDNIRTYDYLALNYDPANPNPLAPILDDIANGVIDVGVLWGPPAGYYAAREGVGMTVAQVDPPFEPPFIPMYINMSMGVRLGDEALRDRLDLIIAQRWEEIYAILNEYNIPYMDLPRPTVDLGAP
jgi:mxaJ protein